MQPISNNLNTYNNAMTANSFNSNKDESIVKINFNDNANSNAYKVSISKAGEEESSKQVIIEPVVENIRRRKSKPVSTEPDIVEEINGALSKLKELLEELKEQPSKSKKDSTENQKSYGFGVGAVSLNTFKLFQTTSTPTVGAAEGSAIHFNSDSETPIVNQGSSSQG